MPSTTEPAPPGRARILVIDEDRAMAELIATWLDAEGHVVVRAGAGSPPAEASVDLIIVDLPFPRACGVDSARRAAGLPPMTPILALSCTLFAGVECGGPVARSLGVDCVLPKPVTRQALLRQVHRLLGR